MFQEDGFRAGPVAYDTAQSLKGKDSRTDLRPRSEKSSSTYVADGFNYDPKCLISFSVLIVTFVLKFEQKSLFVQQRVFSYLPKAAVADNSFKKYAAWIHHNYNAIFDTVHCLILIIIYRLI